MKGRRHHDAGFVLIGIFKLIKGALLAVVGLGALSLLHRDVSALVNHWARALQLNMQSHWIQNLLIKVGMVDDRKLGLVAATTFFYSALLLIEGAGLLLEKVWAEYLTCIVTASFIPVEVYELFRHVSASRVVILALNIAVVVYLVVRLRQGGKWRQAKK